MAEFKVTSRELRNKADELRKLNGNFQRAVGDLCDKEGQLMGQWDGEAKDAFHNAFNADKAQMDTFYNVIEKYIQALTTNADKYEQTEAQNTQTATARSYK